MAALLAGLLDRLVLVCATLAGGCVPGFLAQYRQRAGGRLDQVIADLKPFRQIAERFHGGSLDALIQHHLASADQTFKAEGAAIQAMAAAEIRLRGIVEALQGGVWEQLAHVARYPDVELLRATWSTFVPSFTLDAQGILMAVAIGLWLWLLFIAVWRGVHALVRVVTRPRLYGTRRT